MIAQRSDAQIRSCVASDVADKIEIVEVDDIISYHDVVTAEKASLQKGMNYGVGKKKVDQLTTS